MSEFDQRWQQVNNQFNFANVAPHHTGIDERLFGTWECTTFATSVDGNSMQPYSWVSGSHQVRLDAGGRGVEVYTTFHLAVYLPNGTRLDWQKEGHCEFTYSVGGDGSYSQITEPFVGYVSVAFDGIIDDRGRQRSQNPPVYQGRYMVTDARLTFWNADGMVDYHR